MFGLKKKLMAAVSMLVVSGMMLTTASFAWFTISTNPEISGLTTTVVVNENLELAVAKASSTTGTIDSADAQENYTSTSGSMVGKYYTYGNLVDFTYDSNLASGTLSYDYNAFLTGGTASTTNTEDDVTLAPMTFTTGTGFQYPVYDLEGRVASLANLTTNASDGSFGTLVDGDGNIYGYYIDFWMRSNVGGDLTLTTAVDRANGNDTTETTDSTEVMGGGSTFTSTNEELANNIGIAFEVITSGVDATYAVANTGATTAASVVVATVTPATAVNNSTDNEWITTFSIAESSKIATLVQDEDTLIRMYVYLEGETVTNLAASIDTLLETGTLNVQFSIADVDNAMNVQLTDTTSSG